MSEALSQIGQFFGSPAGRGVMTAGTAGGGLLQNWLAEREAKKKSQFVEDLINNPAKLQKFVAGFDRPLSAGLTQDVARSADAYGAERGLGSSPAVMKDVYAQSLAPFVERQKQEAMQAALQSLGIYGNTPTTKPADITSLFKALEMMNPKPSSPSGPPTVDPGLVLQPSYVPGQEPTLPAPMISSDNVPLSSEGELFGATG